MQEADTHHYNTTTRSSIMGIRLLRRKAAPSFRNLPAGLGRKRVSEPASTPIELAHLIDK
jgi:hypothetical protein